jgi:hypothetical protein
MAFLARLKPCPKRDRFADQVQTLERFTALEEEEPEGATRIREDAEKRLHRET